MLFHWIRIVKSVRPPFSDSKIVGSSFSGVFVYFQTFFCASCSSELILWWRRVELIGKQRSRGQDRKFSCGTFLGSCWKFSWRVIESFDKCYWTFSCPDIHLFGKTDRKTDHRTDPMTDPMSDLMTVSMTDQSCDVSFAQLWFFLWQFLLGKLRRLGAQSWIVLGSVSSDAHSTLTF